MRLWNLHIDQAQNNTRQQYEWLSHETAIFLPFFPITKFPIQSFPHFYIVDFSFPLRGAGLGAGLAQWWERSPPTNVSRVRRHMWVEFVVGSLLCSERFLSGFSGFPLSSKTNISKFQFDLDVRHFSHEPLARVIAQAKIKGRKSLSKLC